MQHSLYRAYINFFLPVLVLKLSDEEPLLLVNVKVYAAVGYHLSRVCGNFHITNKIGICLMEKKM